MKRIARESRSHGLLIMACLLVAALLTARGLALRSAVATNRDMSRLRVAYPHIVGTRLDSCLVCHPAGSWQLNRYGDDFVAANGDFAAIEPTDSDGDGFANGVEIRSLTFPGDPADFPSPTSTATPEPTTEGTEQPPITISPSTSPTEAHTPRPTTPPPSPGAGRLFLPLGYRP